VAQLALNLAIGFAANALISLFTPTQKQEGPRLSDLSTPKSNYSVRIPKVWGAVRLAGNLIWAEPIREKKTKKRRGGKGGPKVQQTTYSYYGSFAMLLCEGPILGVRRIWLSSKLVYNVSDDVDAKTLENSIKFRDNYLRIYTGTATQSPDSLLQASMGAGSTPAYRYRAYIVFDELPLADYANRFPTVTVEVVTVGTVSNGRITAQKADLANIIRDICYSAGLSAGEVYTSEINQPVTGFFINNVQAARESLSQLQQAYFFDCVESGGKLKFINQQRPGLTTQVIKSHLAAYEYGQQRPNNFQETRTQDLELPSEVAVTYLDPSFNYGEAVQYSRKSVAANQNAQNLSLPIVLTSSEAKTIADRLLYLAWTKRRNYKLTVTLRYGLLDPGDLVSVPFHGSNYQTIQISKLNIGANLLLEIEATAYESSTFAHQATVETQYHETIDSKGNNIYQLPRRSLSRIASVRSGSTTYSPGVDYTYDLVAGTVTRVEGGSIGSGAALTISYELDEVSPPPENVTTGGNTTLRILDIPLVSDSDADNGLYLAADGNESWRFATVYVSRNGGASYELAKNLSDRSTFGTCNTVLATGPTSGMDNANSLSVTIRAGGELESVSLTDLNNGQNTALVGKEIIRFQTATLTGTNTYTLSQLQRGRRGTEWAIATHAAGESFYLLSDYLERVEGDVADIGRTLQFKAVTDGQTLNDVSPISLTGAGNSLKPYAPVNLAATKDPLGNVTITWTRRDRKAGDRTDYANFPLSEVSERYEIEFYNGASIVRTLTSNSPTVTYTAAQQTSDFGSLLSTISCRVYQMSTVVGRGYGAIATLTPTLVYLPPAIASLNPTQGAIGQNVIITGNHFTGTTSVAFNGTVASFTVNSGTQITATVPVGATSGPVTVTTPGGTASI
jgi:hypothetical protein